jgi:membrane associated rhomboid family serine protease
MNIYTKSKKGIIRLIFLNSVTFLLANILISTSGGYDFLSNLALSSNVLDVILKPWTIFTSMFLHVDFLHILFNMLYLYVFGQILSSRLGSQSVVTVYVFGAFVGAIFYLLFYNVISGSQEQYLALGASGGVMAIMAAATTLDPNKKIRVFLLGAIKIKWIFLVLFIMTSIYNIDINTGGKIDHMGGAFFGFIYITLIRTRNLFLGRWFDKICLYFSYDFSKKNIYKKNKKYPTGFRGGIDRRDFASRDIAVQNFMKKEEMEEELDKLLARVKKVGFEKLDEEDKNRLIYLSKKL